MPCTKNLISQLGGSRFLNYNNYHDFDQLACTRKCVVCEKYVCIMCVDTCSSAYTFSTRECEAEMCEICQQEYRLHDLGFCDVPTFFIVCPYHKLILYSDVFIECTKERDLWLSRISESKLCKRLLTCHRELF